MEMVFMSMKNSKTNETLKCVLNSQILDLNKHVAL